MKNVFAIALIALFSTSTVMADDHAAATHEADAKLESTKVEHHADGSKTTEKKKMKKSAKHNGAHKESKETTTETTAPAHN